MATTRKKKRKTAWFWLALIAMLAGAIALWQTRRTSQSEDAPMPGATQEQAATSTPSAPSPEAAPTGRRHPIEDAGVSTAPREDLPAVDQSDATVAESLSALTDGNSLDGLLRHQNVVRNIVVTIDNLPRTKVASRLLPMRPAEGRLATEKGNGGIAMADSNAARYTPYIALAEQVDAKEVVSLYVRLYPLFQRSYEELGYPDGYFNDRLIEVIDHMLEAPAPEGPVLLKQPHILYQFADPALEASSAGHKLMIRMGRDNADRVKRKLQEVRSLLVNRQPS